MFYSRPLDRDWTAGLESGRAGRRSRPGKKGARRRHRRSIAGVGRLAALGHYRPRYWDGSTRDGTADSPVTFVVSGTVRDGHGTSGGGGEIPAQVRRGLVSKPGRSKDEDEARQLRELETNLVGLLATRTRRRARRIDGGVGFRGLSGVAAAWLRARCEAWARESFGEALR